MKKSVSVTVPASSGNIGPGFDVLGLALRFRNELQVRVLSSKKGEPLIRIVGEGEGSLPRDRRNLIYKTIVGLFKKAGEKVPKLELICVNRIPLARGLGSSSAAYLSALLAANKLLSNRYSKNEILNFATKLEGHPDNVASALFGGIQASGVFNGHVATAAFPVPSLKMVVAVPAFELSTKKARAVLPKNVPMKDAVQNLSSVALLTHAFKNDEALLKLLLNDRLHEPYRAKLIPGFSKVKKAALRAGAHGVILSGAGPTMLALTPRAKSARVAKAMHSAFSKAGVQSSTYIFDIDRRGAIVS